MRPLVLGPKNGYGLGSAGGGLPSIWQQNVTTTLQPPTVVALSLTVLGLTLFVLQSTPLLSLRFRAVVAVPAGYSTQQEKTTVHDDKCQSVSALFSSSGLALTVLL